ncbi:MAG: hypothetical protein LBV38_00240 [Alistipes sp.]|jgi:hypothetical protein|nr:hypothetical protein [Alistipes sp.]
MKVSKLILNIVFLLVLQAVRADIPGDLRINEIQVIGSHNSYKRAIEPVLLKEMQKVYPAVAGLEYAHIDIPDQLELGLRNLEVDVYADSQGGRYANPKGLTQARGQSPYNTDGVMDRPGFKVLHSPDYDFRTGTPTLEILLGQLREWSNANPEHTPVFITLETKDSTSASPNRPGAEILTPETFDRLDNEIATFLGRDKLITPDMVRGEHATLNEAATNGGWPTVREAQGKFLFILDDRGAKRDMYVAEHPSLRGRVLFVNADPETPEAATLIRNNSRDVEIPALVRAGYLIRTRADADTRQARANDYTTFVAAAASGAQIITTDYYRPSEFFDSPYVVHFADGGYERENPLFAKPASRVTVAENDRVNGGDRTSVSGHVRNSAGEPVIAEIQLHSGREYSPYRYSAIRVFPTDRDGRFYFLIPRGHEGTEFRLIVTKGSEYEFVEVPFGVEAQHNTTVDVNIARITDDLTRKGWWGGDAHQHSVVPYGSDGYEPYNEVALQNVASGNSWGSLSEHRHFNSTESFVGEVKTLRTDFAGNGGKFFPLEGYEWTSSDRDAQGHMNVFGHGKEMLLSSTFAPETDTEKRNAEHARRILTFQGAGAFVQANHPAGGRLRFMREVGFDRAWFVDAWEIWNDGDRRIPLRPWEEAENPAAFERWFEALNMGIRMVGTATTDAHNIDFPAKRYGDGGTIATFGATVSDTLNPDGSLKEPSGDSSDNRSDDAEAAQMAAFTIAYLQNGHSHGDIRTYVHLPRDINEADLLTGLRNGQSFMTNGPLLFASLNGQEPDARYGHEAVVGPDGKATLSIDLLSNRNVEMLYVIADGELMCKIPVNADRYRGELTLDLTGKRWVMVDVWGDRLTRAYTNPIFLATDRNREALAAKAELVRLVKSAMTANPSVELVGVSSGEQPTEIVRLRRILDAVVRPILFNPNATPKEVDRAITDLTAAM